MSKFRMIDLFSGIGGFSLSASLVWGDALDIVCFCEKDEFCQRVLGKHWPEVPIVNDINNLDEIIEEMEDVYDIASITELTGDRLEEFESGSQRWDSRNGPESEMVRQENGSFSAERIGAGDSEDGRIVAYTKSSRRETCFTNTLRNAERNNISSKSPSHGFESNKNRQIPQGKNGIRHGSVNPRLGESFQGNSSGNVENPDEKRDGLPQQLTL